MRIISFFLFLLSCFFVYTKQLDIEIDAKNAILINPENDCILFEKNAYEKIYPASVTKIATALYILENHRSNISNYYVGSEDALKTVTPDKKKTIKSLSPYVLETDGHMFNIMKGEKLKLNDLLYGILFDSGNDASNVAAEAVEGSVEIFMKNLNKFVGRLGCRDTNFCNPHGLHHIAHVTTAYDLSLLTKEALDNSDFMDIFTCKFYVRPKTNKQDKKELVTANKLLKPGRYYCPYVIGGKTGYHAKAGYNLSSVATKDGRTLIAVVLGYKKSDDRFEDVKKMFEKAFEEKKVSKKIMDAKKEFKAKLEGAQKTLTASLKKDLYIDYFPSEEMKYKAYLVWDDLTLPVNIGQKVGMLNITDQNGGLIKKQAVFADNKVKRTFTFYLKELFHK